MREYNVRVNAADKPAPVVIGDIRRDLVTEGFTEDDFRIVGTLNRNGIMLIDCTEPVAMFLREHAQVKLMSENRRDL